MGDSNSRQDFKEDSRARLNCCFTIDAGSYRDLFSLARNGILLCGVSEGGSCTILNANPAALRKERLSRDELIGEEFERVVPGAVDFGIIDIIREVNSTGVPRHISPKRYSDSRIDILRDMSVYRLKEGVIAIVYDDVSDSVDACTRLEESKPELDRLVSNLPGIAFRCKNDKEWTMEVVSRGIIELTGYRPEEIIGNKELPYSDLIYAEDREMVWDLIQESFAARDNYEIEYRIVTKSGQVKYVLERGKVVAGENGGEVFVEGFISDVTDLRVARREAEESKEKLEATFTSTINALSRIVEIRDPYTSGHQRKVGLLAASISRRMGLEDRLCENIRISGLLHDIGKLWIPSEILSKPGRLNHIEFEMIKEHSRLGYEVLKEIEFDFPIADYVIQHHERLNGSGYPFGLKGEEILMPARIIAVADVVEAISSHRPYRPALGVEVAIEEITSGAGTLYDGSVTRACVGLLEDGFSFE
jgi:PAS domain S-box-containing protein/putative nucleotidyltransferase with HDIG domain